MSRLLTIISIFLLPVMAFAKTGEPKASFERSNTRVTVKETPGPKIMPNGVLYQNKETGYSFVAWFQLGKFAGAAAPVTSDDELTKFVQLVLGTTDLQARTDLNPLLGWTGVQGFSTKDGKLAFNTYPLGPDNPDRLVVAGTIAFIESYESAEILLMARHLSGTPALDESPTPTPTPAPTPTPTDASWQFSDGLGKATELVTSALADVKDVAAARAAVPAFKDATTQLRALKGVWDRLSSQEKTAFSVAVNIGVRPFEDLSAKLSALPGMDNTVLQAVKEYIDALKGFQP